MVAFPIGEGGPFSGALAVSFLGGYNSIYTGEMTLVTHVFSAIYKGFWRGQVVFQLSLFRGELLNFGGVI